MPFLRMDAIPSHTALCPKCGRPQPSGILCPSCVSWQSAIEGIRSPFRFEGVMRQAVHELKYRNLRALAAPLGGMLAEYLNANPIPADVLVPVPMHPGKCASAAIISRRCWQRPWEKQAV